MQGPCTDVDRPGSWKKFKNGMCEGCWAGCCTMPVEVKASDLVRMGLVSSDEIETSPKKAAAKLMRMGVVRSYRASTGLFTLERRRGRDCWFLGEDRRCTIYERRPDVCRNFPNIGRRPGYCPAGPKE